MANNPYVNKVQKADGTTIIDITPTTAVASDVAEGKYFFTASGQLTLGTLQGGGGTAIIRDTTDSAGGTIREITTDEELYLDDLSVTQNGTYNAPSGTAYDSVSVNVQTEPTLQTKSATYTPTESQQTATITADSGYDGLEEVDVTVNAISNTYVGSGITRRSSTDLTVSGATVTAPSGYYSESASKSVSSMTLPTSASTTRSYTSKATVGRSTSAQYINIPTGYNATGASYTISATPNGTVTAPSSISGTSATVSTGTNTLTLTKSVSVTPSVTTAGYVSSGTAGNSSVSLTANVTTQGATTITPSTSQQTAVSSGTYVTGNVVVSAMSSGTAGTPTATKGTVSNNSVSITPSVTNTTGYITGGTKNGTAITFTASELVSGTKTITENGTGIDVTNYASVDVNVVKKYTATITTAGYYDDRAYMGSYVTYPSSGSTVRHYTLNETFEFTAGDIMKVNSSLYSTGSIIITVDGVDVVNTNAAKYTYQYTLPENDITIDLDTSRTTSNHVYINSAGGNVFTVKFSFNTSTNMWEPNCSYSDVYDAYSSGKKIVGYAASSYTPVFIEYFTESSNGFYYSVLEHYEEYSPSYVYGYRAYDYRWTSSEIADEGTTLYSASL